MDDPPGPFDSLEESKVSSVDPAVRVLFKVLCRVLQLSHCCRPTARPWRRRTTGCRGSCRISSGKSSLLDESWRTESSKSVGWRRLGSNDSKNTCLCYYVIIYPSIRRLFTHTLSDSQHHLRRPGGERRRSHRTGNRGDTDRPRGQQVLIL